MHSWKTKILFVSLTIFVFFFLLTPQPAHAFVWWPVIIGGSLLVDYLLGSPFLSAAAQPLLDALAGFVNVFLGTLAFLLQGIYIGIAEVMVDILQALLAVSVVPDPTEVPFVYDAWNFSRGFVNGIFLLILVFIGLATILRLQSYQMQRTLPLLIIVALLVNFSGVFIGIVVDIGNIIANYFLDASTEVQFELNPWFGDRPYYTLEKMGQNIARILFFLFGILIYFTLIFVFAVRVIVLWTISILAPFAFAAFILPATRKWGQQWLSSLIQWALIGAPISFFLYLAGRAVTADFTDIVDAGIDNAIVAVFAPASALLLLVVGIGFSMSLAPAWGRRVALLGAVAGIAGGVGLGYLGLRRYGSDVQKLFGNIRQRAQGIPLREEEKTGMEKWLGRTGQLPGVKQVSGALAGWGKREVLRGGRWRTVRRVQPDGTITEERIQTQPSTTETIRAGLAGRVFGLGGKIVTGAASTAESGMSQLVTLANKSAQEAFNKAMREAQKLRPQDNAVRIRDALVRPTRESSMTALANYMKMVVDDDPSDIESLVASGALSQNHLKKIFQTTKQLRDPNHYRMFLKSQISRIKDFEPSWGENDINRFIHRFVRMEDISKINIDWHQYDPTDPERAETLDRLLVQMARNPLPAMMQAISSPEARRRIWEHLEAKDDNWYIDNNKEDILLWSTSNAAIDQFGLAPLHGLTRAQITKKRDERRFKNRSTDSLKQERAKIEEEIQEQSTSPTISQREINRLRKRTTRIDEELEIRDTNINSDTNLAQETSTLTTTIEGLENQLNAQPQHPQAQDWHRQKAQAALRLRDVELEQQRRLKEKPSEAEAQKGITIPPLLESIGEQIATKEIQTREIREYLRQRGELPDRKEKEKELDKLRKEIGQLRLQRNRLPQRIRQKEDELQRTQRNYLEVQKRIEELSSDIEEDRALGRAEAVIQEQVRQLTKAQGALKQLETERTRLRQDRSTLFAGTRGLLQPPDFVFAEQLANNKAQEWELTRQLRQQQATHASEEAIRRTQNLLTKTKGDRETFERKLAAVLRAQDFPNQTPRFKNMEGDWDDPSKIIRRGQIINELNRIDEQLLANPPQAQRQALESQRNALQTEFQDVSGLADINPDAIRDPLAQQDREAYLQQMTQIMSDKTMRQRIDALVRQHEATEKKIHREARRKEEEA